MRLNTAEGRPSSDADADCDVIIERTAFILQPIEGIPPCQKFRYEQRTQDKYAFESWHDEAIQNDNSCGSLSLK
jgi:hypothetical protein